MPIDVETLNSLGLDAGKLQQMVIDQCCDVVLRSPVRDENGETSYQGRFLSKLSAEIQKAIDEKIADVAREHVMPKISSLVDSATFKATNRFGERKGPEQTFLEYLNDRATAYISEPVNHDLQSKAEADARGNGYNWREEGPRLVVAMKIYLKDSMEKAARLALTDVNKKIVDAMTRTAVNAIKSVADSVKIEVK